MNLEIEISELEIEVMYRRIGFNVKKLRQEKGLSQLRLNILSIRLKYLMH